MSVAQRPPNILARFLFLAIAATAIGSGIWFLTENLWWAIPGGLVLGYIITAALIVFGERNRDGCFPKEPGP